MRELLMKKLSGFIKCNNPEIFAELNDVGLISKYLEVKVGLAEPTWKRLTHSGTPVQVIQEVCIDEITKDLKPSKYNYIINLLQEEFEFAYQQWCKAGILQYEVILVMHFCQPLFESLHFTEKTEDNVQLKHAITNIISEYLND